jgi:hypothetical protein
MVDEVVAATDRRRRMDLAEANLGEQIGSRHDPVLRDRPVDSSDKL